MLNLGDTAFEIFKVPNADTSTMEFNTAVEGIVNSDAVMPLPTINLEAWPPIVKLALSVVAVLFL